MNSLTQLVRFVSEAVHIQSGIPPAARVIVACLITMVIIQGSTRLSAMLWYSVEIFGRKELPETGLLGLDGVTVLTGYLSGPRGIQ
jgi:hypothetical protein